MKISFVRHGETDHNKQGLVTGFIDIPLNKTGVKQAEDTLINQDIAFTMIYSSDLIRCKQTADIINKKLKLTISYDDRLRERNLGSFEGTAWNDMDDSLREKDRIQEYDYQPFGGESIDDVKDRLNDFLKDMKTKHPHDHIIAVTSGGIIRLLHNMINNHVIEKIHNSSVHEFEFE